MNYIFCKFSFGISLLSVAEAQKLFQRPNLLKPSGTFGRQSRPNPPPERLIKTNPRNF